MQRPKMRLFSSCGAALAGLAIVVATGCSTTPAASADQKPVLVDLTNDVILPTYRAVDTSAGALQTAAAAFDAAPSAATLKSVQDAWRAAHKAWHQADAFGFGPVKTKDISGTINYSPARGTTIDGFIAGAGPIDAASFDALGTNAKGYFGIEYVLFDSSAGDAAVLSRLTTDAAAKRRRQYLVVATAHLKGKTAELLAAWEPTGGNFAKEVTEAGSGAVLFPSAKSAIDQIVNTAIFSVDLVTGTKIAKPYGAKSGGSPLPDQEESPRSDNSIADMLDTLDGARAIYTGAYGGVDGKGISDLVRAKNASLDDRVITAMDDARAKISAIPPPFRTAITAQRPAVEAAYQSSRTLKTLLATEVAGALATTLQFNDNDGD